MKYYLLLLITLTSCGKDVIIPNQVLVPVSVTCVKADIDKPDFVTHEQLILLPSPDFVKQQGIELNKYEGYVPKLEAVIASCK